MNERGNAEMITLIGGLCILVIIATIVAIMNVNAHNPFIINPTPTPTTVTSPSSSPEVSPSASPVTHTPGQALAEVRTFYLNYSQNTSVVNQYVTTELASKLS